MLEERQPSAGSGTVVSFGQTSGRRLVSTRYLIIPRDGTATRRCSRETPVSGPKVLISESSPALITPLTQSKPRCLSFIRKLMANHTAAQGSTGKRQKIPLHKAPITPDSAPITHPFFNIRILRSWPSLLLPGGGWGVGAPVDRRRGRQHTLL